MHPLPSHHQLREIPVDEARLGDAEVYARWKRQALGATAVLLPLADYAEVEKWKTDVEDAERRKSTEPHGEALPPPHSDMPLDAGLA